MSLTDHPAPPRAETAAADTQPRRRHPRRTPRTSAGHRTPGSWLMLAVLALGAVLTLAPLALAALNAFKTKNDYVDHGPLSLPHELTLQPLQDFWNYGDFSNKLFNSILISASVAVIGVLISLLAAYALGIGRVRGRFGSLAVVVVAFAMPQEALIYPVYYMLRQVGLYDTKISVIIVLSPLSATYMLSAVLSDFPPEILEAARIDGAGRLRILVSVIAPVLRPTLGVLATFFFIWTWNDFFVPLILLPSSDNQTVSVSLGLLFGQFTTDPVLAAAAALAGLLPTLLFFVIFQRTLTKGITVGSVK